eukprot:366474-Chlamydomonas_euryale.AAC.35
MKCGPCYCRETRAASAWSRFSMTRTRSSRFKSHMLLRLLFTHHRFARKANNLLADIGGSIQRACKLAAGWQILSQLHSSPPRSCAHALPSFCPTPHSLPKPAAFECSHPRLAVFAPV